MIPEYAREGVPVDLQDSANLKSTILIHIHSQGVDISPTIATRILDIHNSATEQAPTPSAVLYLYFLVQKYCPFYHFLNGHSSQEHQKDYNQMAVGMACYYRH